MKRVHQLDSSAVKDCIKETLTEENPLKIYNWMLDANLRQADLFVFACIFEQLRHEPSTPQYVKVIDIANRLHYRHTSILHSIQRLVENEFLYVQGTSHNKVYSLYPFGTLDLK